MQTKFDVGDFLLLKEGHLEKIGQIHVDDNDIRYDSRGCNSIIKESQITPEYILDLENYLKLAQKTLEIMKEKLNIKKLGE